MHLYHSTQPPGTQLGELQCVCALGRPMEIPAVLSSKQQQPPAQALYVKLKSSLLQAVLEGKSQISLVVGDDVTLQVDDSAYKATINSEASHVDIYKGHQGKFEDIGTLSHRLMVQNVASACDISCEDRALVLHVLAIQPISIRDLAKRTKLNEDKIYRIAKEFGTPSDPKETTFSLQKSVYGSINLNWAGYSQQERLSVQLGTKAWLNGLKNNQQATAPTAVKRTPTPVVTTKEKDNAVVKPVNGVKRPLDDDEVLELARKFKHQYTEYARLYTQRHQSQEELQRLATLHKKLALWKQRIWAHNRSSKVAIKPNAAATTRPTSTKVKQST